MTLSCLGVLARSAKLTRRPVHSPAGPSQLKRNSSENHNKNAVCFFLRLFPRIGSKWRIANGNIQTWKTRTKARQTNPAVRKIPQCTATSTTLSRELRKTSARLAHDGQ